MEWHPFAKLFPMLPDDRLQELADDIAAHGQQQPIVIDDEERILDGRNRAAACLLAGVQPICEPFVGSERQKLDLVVSLNIHRRHLTESQRAMIAAKVSETDTSGGAAKGNRHASKGKTTSQICEVESRVTSTAAAEALAVSPRSVSSARKVNEKGTPELQQAVTDGDISVSAAAHIADQPAELQNEVVSQVKAGQKPYTPHGKSKKHQRSDEKPVSGFNSEDFLNRLQSLLESWTSAAIPSNDRPASAVVMRKIAADLLRKADELDPEGSAKPTGKQRTFLPTPEEQLYQAYPRRVGRGQAMKAIRSALKKSDFETLLSAVTEFGECQSDQEQSLIPHPATWFNGERWLDDRSDWTAHRAKHNSDRVRSTARADGGVRHGNGF